MTQVASKMASADPMFTEGLGGNKDEPGPAGGGGGGDSTEDP